METTNPDRPAKRPVFLTVLCILTFIMTGFSVLGWIANVFRGKLSTDEVEESTAAILEVAGMAQEQGMSWLADVYEKTARMIAYTNDAHYLMLFLNFLTLTLGFFGALLMWNGRRIGFHAYVLYNLVGILSIYAAVPIGEVSSFVIILQVIFSGIFIFMYSRNLHWLR